MVREIILFDSDGTLVDSVGEGKYWRNIYKKIHDTPNMSQDEMFSRMREIDTLEYRLNAITSGEISLFEDTIPALEWLSKQTSRKYDMYVISDSSINGRIVLEKLGILKYFKDTIFDAHKPNTAAAHKLLHGADYYHAEKLWVIGDKECDVSLGKNLSAETIQVDGTQNNRLHAAYRIIRDSLDRK